MALKRELEVVKPAIILSPVHITRRFVVALLLALGLWLCVLISPFNEVYSANRLPHNPLPAGDSLPKPKSPPMLSVLIRLIDAESDTIVTTAKLSATNEKSGQAVPIIHDSRGFNLSVLPGTSLLIQASAPDYLAAKTRLFNLAESQPVLMKLVHTRPSVLTIKAFAMKISQPLSPATAIITSRTTGRSERIALTNGLLKKEFAKPDNLDIEVMSPGYTSVSRQLAIEVPPLGKRYEFDAELDKITFTLTVRAIDSLTNKPISGGRFAVTGPAGPVPIVLAPMPKIGLSTADLPGQGLYQLATDVRGYQEITRSVVVNKGKNEIVVKLVAKQPVIDPKQADTVADADIEEATPSSVSAVTTKLFGVVERGKSIRLNKIYFDQSSPVLRTESYTELDQLYDVLKQYPSLRIEIRGFTDNQGDFDLNTQLSRDRCQAVIDYLVGKGIRKNRLKALGRGPLDPVAPNNNEDNRKKNRRVEFAIL